MHDLLPVHESLLVNTLGHSAGTVIFAIFLFLLLRDRAGARLRGSGLTLAAAALALVWNFASLLVIAWNSPSSTVSEALVALSSSALTFLPAVLLHISLESRFPWITRAGYGIAALTMAIHASELLVDAPEHHLVALQAATAGFGTLTLLATIGLLARGVPERRGLTGRLVATMSVFLFAVSLVHFGSSHTHSWPGELIAHHAGILLALFILLQDYRFLLLDAFVRFLANILFAAVFVFAVVSLVRVQEVVDWAASSTFREGMLLVGGCLLLLAYSFARTTLDHLLNRMVFPRNDVEQVLHAIRTHAAAASDEKSMVALAAEKTAAFWQAGIVDTAPPAHAPLFPSPVSDLASDDRTRLERAGVEAVVPLRLSANEIRYLLLGRRKGGRRYLSEDFAALARIQVELAEQLDRFREVELRRLVSQAELRALQSQIHPHFLFNALNTLYGVIPREATGARRTVLNLADIFRYFLQTDRSYIPLEEELQIVRAYLEIESLRLGSKLRSEIDVEPAALRTPIPSLTVEPLVENAVKHGVAARPEGGTVRVEARMVDGALRVRVHDTGAGFGGEKSTGAGVGLENVVKRLRLCYGPAADLRIDSDAGGTRVEFRIPVAEGALL